jgi:hypothetical protein
VKKTGFKVCLSNATCGATKWWALKLAVEAVTTVLRVDQIIMVGRRRTLTPPDP